MTKDSLRNIFANASVIKPIAQEAYLTDKDRAYEEEIRVNSGLITFKRRVMGLCGQEAIKSIDELAEILTSIKVAENTGEAKELITRLYGKKLNYRSGWLKFDEIENKSGRKVVRIRQETQSIISGYD